jgi:uncharacterized protein GlcG (DUF336 family)
MSTTRQITSISRTAALSMVQAALDAAEAAAERSSIAITDAGGHLVAFARMDGAPAQSIQIAQDKAYTAAGFGIPTAQWHDFMTQDAPLAAGAPTSIERFVPFGGGLPIIVDGQLVGGIGVSGGHWSADSTIATAGLGILS